ncbi:hypothetical protein APHAL10511_002417 [Amanita phalloides]|nr:hypothetical protein APHAL10511_002417 [Amanita phalloides]
MTLVILMISSSQSVCRHEVCSSYRGDLLGKALQGTTRHHHDIKSLFALPLISTPYFIRSAGMGNCIVSTNRGVHGAPVVTTPQLFDGVCPANTIVRIAPHSNGYHIWGQAGLYIRPSKNGRRLVWNKKPFTWRFLSVDFGYYLIEGGKRVWRDNPRNPKNVDLVKAKSTETEDYYWTLRIA